MSIYTPTTEHVRHAYYMHNGYERMIRSLPEGDPSSEFGDWLLDVIKYAYGWGMAYEGSGSDAPLEGEHREIFQDVMKSNEFRTEV